MHIKRIHEMIEKVTECANSQLAKGTDCVDTEEMEKVACIIKDMCEAEYYSKISKAMDDYSDEDVRYYDNYRYKTSGRFAPKGKGSYMPRMGYEEPPYYHMTPDMYLEHDPKYYRDMDRENGRLYFSEPITMESRYDRARRGYEETKAMHKDNSSESKQMKMKSLEDYMKSLAEDVTEMVNDMSQEEKSLMKQKMQVLMQKIN